jgi:hypothetical protein
LRKTKKSRFLCRQQVTEEDDLIIVAAAAAAAVVVVVSFESLKELFVRSG